ncbi:MAG: DUF4249 domain-containing protein [Bacteroidetes bacterium]|nr:DUF4249 domain-containing protein [Bacteroidota bacterium]
MKKNFGTYIVMVTFIALSAMILLGCEQDADIEVPQSTPKLVVTCFISPEDSLITVRLDKSRALFSNTNEPFDPANATVAISNGITEVTVPYNQDQLLFEIDQASAFTIVPGANYKLKCSYPGLPLLLSQCTVPAERLTEIKLALDSSNAFEYLLKMNFQDLPGIKNYYRTFAFYNYTDTNYFGLGDTTYTEPMASDDNNLLNDVNNDGGQYSTVFTYLPKGKGPDTLQAVILTCSEEYYKFHYSLFTYGYDNPFSEASPIYSNIVNGLGVFAAYRKAEKKIAY